MSQNQLYEKSSNLSINSDQKRIYDLKSSKSSHFLQANCAFHPENFIRNFCKNPQCLMPMCSECVKLHQQMHAEAGTHGNFETIEVVGQQCESELKKMQKKLKKQQKKIDKFEKTVDQQDQMIFETLREAKQRTKQVIDDYFTQIEKTIKTQLMTQKANHLQQLGITSTKIYEKEKEISSIRKKISKGNSFLKHIIQFCSSTHSLNINMLEQETRNNISVLSTQFMNLQTQDAVLQNIANILQNFLVLKNANINNNKSMRSSLINGPLALTPQIVNSPMKQSIPRMSPLNSPLRTSIAWNTTRNNLLQPSQYPKVQAIQNRTGWQQPMRIQYL